MNLSIRNPHANRALRNKVTVTLTALFLMLMIASTLVALPNVNAHDPPQEVPTFAYITAAPSPVGVNQPVSLTFWLDKVPPTAAGFAGDRWTDMTIEVTKPDGSQETLGPFISDPVGGGYALYTPDQTGTYTFEFIFPGQVAGLYHPETGLAGSPSDYINDTYLPSTATATLDVQSTEILHAPEFPLPTSYWTRPIEGQNQNWATISSHYLSGSAITGHYQPDGTAPDSPHIMWTKPISFGGVVGGSNVGSLGMTFYDGTNYEGKFGDPIIIYGRLYYSLPKSDATTGGGYVCVDLQTGEELWYRTDLGNTLKAPSFAQLYDYESMNQHGVIPNGYLWSTTGGGFFGPPGPQNWTAYDPLTGDWLFTLTDVPSGTEIIGPQGEILRYVLNLQGGWLACWNNTAVQTLTGATDPNDYTSTSYYQWRPVGKTANASNAYSWNVSIPALAPGSSIQAAVYDDMVIVNTPLASFLSFGTPDMTTVSAISLKEANRGELLWTTQMPAPTSGATRAFGVIDATARVFTWFDKETISWTGYSMDTGKELWTTASENPWNFYSGAGGAMTTSAAAEGKLFSTGYSGELYCYDLTTGDVMWTYSAPSGLETPYSGYPLGISGIADGKIYLATNEHSSGAPYWKEAQMRCVDIETGDEVWTLYGHQASSYGDGGAAIADGYFVYLNLYDMQIYCIGKGPSEVTVDAPMTAIPSGESLIIRGTVTDRAAGAEQLVDSGKFNTVPAVSDASMRSWMEYLYMQKPKPADATGVPVYLTAIDPNNNFQEIGTAISDDLGNFVIDWTPPVPGVYKVTATFAGTGSYWGSEAGTSFLVSEPVSAAPAEVTPTQPPTTTITTPAASTPAQSVSPSPLPSEAPQPATTAGTPTLTYVAIGAAVIVIVAAAAALLLKRRK
ncbi:MAG: PQQ-binding-like beta-propeller repeat protein [Candidatus Bathyarchaeota archaeon]|nr:PQQ-binding-like beta-propeller repeat protein [Candidatus Bathyarchaeota archaeon]